MRHEISKKRILFALAAVAAILSMSSCSQLLEGKKYKDPTTMSVECALHITGTVSPSTRVAGDLMNNISGTRLNSQGGTLLLGADGSFDFTDNRSLEMTLTASGGKFSDENISGATDKLTIQIQKIAVTASKASVGGTPSAFGGPSAADVCQFYIDSLANKRTMEWFIRSYSKDHLALATGQMLVDGSMKGAGAVHISSSSYTLASRNNSHRFFMRPGSTLDVTSESLRELEGHFSGGMEIGGSGPFVDLKMHADTRSFELFTDTCGTLNTMSVQNISYNDQGTLVMKAKRGETTTYPVNSEYIGPNNSQQCAALTTMLDHATDEGIAVASYLWDGLMDVDLAPPSALQFNFGENPKELYYLSGCIDATRCVM